MTVTATYNSGTTAMDITVAWSTHTVANLVRVDYATMTTTVVTTLTLVAGTWSGSDYEAPLNTDFYYVATSGRDQISSSLKNNVDTTRPVWLKHLGNHTLATTIRLQIVPVASRPSVMTLVNVLGRSNPIAISGKRGSLRGDLMVVTLTATERNRLIALVDDGTTLLLQAPIDYGIGVNSYVNIGDVAETPIVKARSNMSLFDLPFTTVDRPSTGTPNTNTWGSLLGIFATWADLLVAVLSYPATTWQDILDGLTAGPIAPTP